MRVLLIYPPIETNLPAGSFPLGLGIVARILLDEGYNVKIYDINAYKYSRVQVENDLKELMHHHDVIGISGMITVYNYIKWLTQLIKKNNPDIPIVVGGSVASSIPELLLKKTEADIACIAEGEETVKELMHTLGNATPLQAVRGIYYKQKDEIFQTPPREIITDLDAIPFPAWELFPVEIYLKNPIIIHGPLRSMNIISGRGCPYQCIYCYSNFGKKVRLRSIDNVLEEIKYLKSRYKIQHVAFQDELFTVKKKRLVEFCQRLIDEKISITWRCLGRVNLVDDLAVLRLMKSAGCHWIGYGIESGSQIMLDVMRKGVKVEQAKRAIRLTREAGISPSGTFMIGLPGETRETVQETVAFCKDVKIFNIPFFTVPYPGTYLYDTLMNEGRIADEEEFISKMQGDATELHINMTEFSDDELRSIKKEAEKEILAYLAAMRKSGVVKKITSRINDVLNCYRWWGLGSAVRRALQIIALLLPFRDR